MRSMNSAGIGRIAKAVAAFACLSIVGPACAQSDVEKPLGTKKPNPSAAIAASPTTEKDMVEAFAKLTKALRGTIKSDAPLKLPAVTASSKTATREQLVLQLNAVFEWARPKFKFTPNALKFDPSRISIPGTSPARAPLEKLIAWQCAGKVGPLAASLQPSLTLKEFGETLGFFSARIADLTHMPSSKWSPYINGALAPQPEFGTDKSKTSPKQP